MKQLATVLRKASAIQQRLQCVTEFDPAKKIALDLQGDWGTGPLGGW